MDIGLLLLRFVLGAVLYMHATQKLYGWFSGPGLDRAGALFDSLGQRPGRPLAVLAVCCEGTGSILVVTGFLTPLGAAMLAGTMLVAGGALTMTKGIVWNAMGGGEYPLVLAAFALVLGFTGPGRWSIDEALGAPWIPHSNAVATVTGIIVLAVAAVAAGVALLRTRAQLTSGAAEATTPPPSAAS